MAILLRLECHKVTKTTKSNILSILMFTWLGSLLQRNNLSKDVAREFTIHFILGQSKFPGLHSKLLQLSLYSPYTYFVMRNIQSCHPYQFWWQMENNFFFALQLSHCLLAFQSRPTWIMTSAILVELRVYQLPKAGICSRSTRLCRLQYRLYALLLLW